MRSGSRSVSSLALLSAGVGLLLASAPVWAASVTDGHGNVGYDTAEECDAAVRAGTAKFYKSFTTKPAFKRAGETSVKVMRLSDVPAAAGADYKLGACDVGARHQGNRDGVAPALQGKYVPISPDFLVNVYYNKAGQPVRSMMKQCDNWFSGPFPRPLAAAPAPRKTTAAPAPVPAPVAVAPAVTPAPAPAPRPAAPVQSQAAPKPMPAPAAAAPAAPTPAPVAPKAAAAVAKGSVFNVPTTVTLLGFAAAGAAVLANQNNDPGTTGTAGVTGTTGTSGTTGTR
jgi:hypothetical protein